VKDVLQKKEDILDGRFIAWHFFLRLFVFASGALFDEIADQAKAGCPVSRVLKADITLTKKLET